MIRIRLLIVIGLCCVSLSSCAPTHYILGTQRPILADYAVVNDFVMGDLRIRRVRALGETQKLYCAEAWQVMDSIQISGPINADATYVVDRLLELIRQSNTCRTAEGFELAIPITLASWGGFVEDGLALGRVIRKHGASTFVPVETGCYSSCAFAFLGGYYRDMDVGAYLMFHAPYRITERNYFFEQINCEASEELRQYFVTMLGNQRRGNLLYERTMSYCSSNDGWTINPAAADIFGLLAKVPGWGG